MAARRTVALMALTTSLILAGVGVGAAANADAATATLNIQRFQDQYGTYNEVAVSGTVPTWYGFGSRVVVRIWGDDKWSDDLLDGPSDAEFDGRHFSRRVWLSDSTLDEDWDGQDEIYAGVRVYDSAGRQRETVETNRVYDYW